MHFDIERTLKICQVRKCGMSNSKKSNCFESDALNAAIVAEKKINEWTTVSLLKLVLILNENMLDRKQNLSH